MDITNILNLLISEHEKHAPKNQILFNHYYGKQHLHNLGIAIPRNMHFNNPIGWCAKVVDALAERVDFTGYINYNNYNISHITACADYNHLTQEIRHATQAALTYGVAFLSITPQKKDWPLIHARSPLQASAIWNPKTRKIAAGLAIGYDSNGGINTYTVYVPNYIYVFDKGKNIIDVVETGINEPTFLAVVNKPELGRPFGRSRISPTIMEATQGAFRTIVRSELGAEFFTAPQKYILGLPVEDVNRLAQRGWNNYIGSMLAMAKPADGENPQVGQFSQQSMTPHTEHLRMFARIVAGEASIPIDELGFPSDNPSSADAINRQREPLVLAAERFKRDLSEVLAKLLRFINAYLKTEAYAVPTFAPSYQISTAEMTDIIAKQTQILPWLADTDIILTRLGYTPQDIDELNRQRSIYNVNKEFNIIPTTENDLPDEEELFNEE